MNDESSERQSMLSTVSRPYARKEEGLRPESQLPSVREMPSESMQITQENPNYKPSKEQITQKKAVIPPRNSSEVPGNRNPAQNQQRVPRFAEDVGDNDPREGQDRSRTPTAVRRQQPGNKENDNVRNTIKKVKKSYKHTAMHYLKHHSEVQFRMVVEEFPPVFSYELMGDYISAIHKELNTIASICSANVLGTNYMCLDKFSVPKEEFSTTKWIELVDVGIEQFKSSVVEFAACNAFKIPAFAHAEVYEFMTQGFPFHEALKNEPWFADGISYEQEIEYIESFSRMYKVRASVKKDGLNPVCGHDVYNFTGSYRMPDLDKSLYIFAGDPNTIVDLSQNKDPLNTQPKELGFGTPRNQILNIRGYTVETFINKRPEIELYKEIRVEFRRLFEVKNIWPEGIRISTSRLADIILYEEERTKRHVQIGEILRSHMDISVVKTWYPYVLFHYIPRLGNDAFQSADLVIKSLQHYEEDANERRLSIKPQETFLYRIWWECRKDILASINQMNKLLKKPGANGPGDGSVNFLNIKGFRQICTYMLMNLTAIKASCRAVVNQLEANKSRHRKIVGVSVASIYGKTTREKYFTTLKHVVSNPHKFKGYPDINAKSCMIKTVKNSGENNKQWEGAIADEDALRQIIGNNINNKEFVLKDGTYSRHFSDYYENMCDKEKQLKVELLDADELDISIFMWRDLIYDVESMEKYIIGLMESRGKYERWIERKHIVIYPVSNDNSAIQLRALLCPQIYYPMQGALRIINKMKEYKITLNTDSNDEQNNSNRRNIHMALERALQAADTSKITNNQHKELVHMLKHYLNIGPQQNREAKNQVFYQYKPDHIDYQNEENLQKNKKQNKIQKKQFRLKQAAPGQEESKSKAEADNLDQVNMQAIFQGDGADSEEHKDNVDVNAIILELGKYDDERVDEGAADRHDIIEDDGNNAEAENVEVEDISVDYGEQPPEGTE